MQRLLVTGIVFVSAVMPPLARAATANVAMLTSESSGLQAVLSTTVRNDFQRGPSR